MLQAAGRGWQANCEAAGRALATLVTLSNAWLVLRKRVTTQNLIGGRVRGPGDKSTRARGLGGLGPGGHCSEGAGPCARTLCGSSLWACGFGYTRVRRGCGAFPPCPPAVTVAALTRGVLSGWDFQRSLSAPAPSRPGGPWERRRGTPKMMFAAPKDRGCLAHPRCK